MKPKERTEDIISKIGIKMPSEDFVNIQHIRDGMAIGFGKYQHLLIRLNGKWRDCCVLTNSTAFSKVRGVPIVYFKNLWLTGTDIKLNKNGQNID